MIEYRKAKLIDIPGIADLAVESMSSVGMPVPVSRPAVLSTLREIVGAAQHFCWVATVECKIVATLAAMTSFGLWFNRQQVSVVLCSAEREEARAHLLSEFVQWVRSRPVIKLGVFELEPGSEGLETELAELGFSRKSMSMIYVRDSR